MCRTPIFIVLLMSFVGSQSVLVLGQNLALEKFSGGWVVVEVVVVTQ